MRNVWQDYSLPIVRLVTTREQLAKRLAKKQQQLALARGQSTGRYSQDRVVKLASQVALLKRQLEACETPTAVN